jgi:hypothetical protein
MLPKYVELCQLFKSNEIRDITGNIQIKSKLLENIQNIAKLIKESLQINA